MAVSINELLDSKTDRAMIMLKKTAAMQPMENSDVSQLGIQAIEFLCEDLAPTSVEEPKHHADIPGTPRGARGQNGQADMHVPPKKNVRTCKRKQYDLSVVRRSSRNKFRVKFHDELCEASSGIAEVY